MTERDYDVILQIKRNGTNRAKTATDSSNVPIKEWTSFKFVLRGQEFLPYSLNATDSADPQGCLKVAGCKATKLPVDQNDKERKFPFKLASETTAYVFNAHDTHSQETTIALLNFAARDSCWYNPFVPNFADQAASRIQGMFYAYQARKLVAAMQANYPHVYLVSINRVVESTQRKNLFGYVSGLVVDPTNNSPQFKTTVPVCISSTPDIHLDEPFHVGVVAYDRALSHVSVSLVDSKDRGKDHQASLGIVSTMRLPWLIYV